jgi:glycosyltransferase involved in cell wall biosynthesis
MHVLYVHQYVGTRAGSGAARSYEASLRLIAAGHTVTVVAARRANSGLADVPRQVIDGIEIISLGGRPYSNRLSAWQRIVEFVRFTFRASKLRVDTRPDVVIATSTPLSVGIPGVRLARRYKVPFVFEVRDLWPRAPIEMGVLRNPLAKYLATKLEHWIYRNATSIVALSPGMTEGVLDAGVDPSRVVTIPNASDPDLFDPERRDRSLLDRWNLADSFVAIHAGTMGAANGLDYLVSGAAVLAERGDTTTKILIMGDGGMRPQLEKRVAELGIDNVVFGGLVTRSEHGAIVSSCDVAITSFADVPVLATNSPNKFFDGLAAGVPVIVNSPGWTRDIVQDNEAGRYVDVHDPAQLADALTELRNDPDLRERLGANARTLATTTFARALLAGRFRRVLENAAEGRPAADGPEWTATSPEALGLR